MNVRVLLALRHTRCWLRSRHKIEWQNALGVGSPPWWQCRCGKRVSFRHPVTGKTVALTDTGWEYVA